MMGRQSGQIAFEVIDIDAMFQRTIFLERSRVASKSTSYTKRHSTYTHRLGDLLSIQFYL